MILKKERRTLYTFQSLLLTFQIEQHTFNYAPYPRDLLSYFISPRTCIMCVGSSCIIHTQTRDHKVSQQQTQQYTYVTCKSFKTETIKLQSNSRITLMQLFTSLNMIRSSVPRIEGSNVCMYANRSQKKDQEIICLFIQKRLFPRSLAKTCQIGRKADRPGKKCKKFQSRNQGNTSTP